MILCPVDKSIAVLCTQVTSNEEAGGPKVEPATPPTGKIGKKEQVPKQGKREGRGVWSPDLAYQARLREVEERYKDVDDRYKGYEILLDDGGVTEDTGITIPTGVCMRVCACVYACVCVCVGVLDVDVCVGGCVHVCVQT